MRVVGVMEFGGPEKLQVFEVPDRHVEPGEVRIAVRAAGLNPTDTLFRSGARAQMLAKFPPPWIPGMDVAGIVDEVGAGVATVKVGDAAMAIVVPDGSHGGYSSSIVLPAASVTRQPRNVTHAEACTLPMNGLTARMALDYLALSPGQTIAITGAAGAFGGYVVQLAKADGLRVIADSSPADEQLVHNLGADIVVRRGPDVAERIRAKIPAGVDGLADGSLQNGALVSAVRDGGVIATVRGWKEECERGITTRPVQVRSYATEWAKLDTLRQQAEDGLVSLRVARTFTPEQAGEAHRLLEAGGVRGRLVIEF